MEKEKVNKWKVAAIIFLILFILETALIIWAIKFAAEEEVKANQCYYDICKDNLNAVYADNLCSCYDYDINKEGYVVSKTAKIF